MQVERQKIPKPVELALRFGIVKQDYTLREYLLEAVETQRYETVLIWGVQGSGKSSRMLQVMYWIYSKYYEVPEEAWKAVLDRILFKPSTFVERLERIPDYEVLPCLGWDDIGVHYPSSKFKTDIKQYEAVDAVWAAIRTKVSVMIITIPLINRLAKNVKDNVTFEIYLGKNQLSLINRWYHLPGLRDPQSNFFKVAVEPPRTFDLFNVPKWVWDQYWDMRIRLTREALETLRGVTDMDDLEGYIRVLDVPKLYPKFKISPTTIQQNISRGVLRGTKIQGQLHVLKEDLELYVESKIPKQQRDR